MTTQTFLMIVSGSVLALFGMLSAPDWADQVIVGVMRSCRIYAYPLAIRLALSLETQPDEWTLDDTTLSHPTIGKVWLINKTTLRVVLIDTNQSRLQTWHPNWIERRIIRDAATGLIERRRLMQLNQALPRLPGL
jgi:hypothetical protein